jgi:hypothetical protein
MRVVVWLLFALLLCLALASVLSPRWVYSSRKALNRASGIVMEEEPRDVTIGLIRLGGCFTFVIVLFMLVALLKYG